MPEPERIDKRSLRYAGRREELLDALTRYVIDNGVGELTVRQLAKAVGVSHASLLNHFESKENLLSEVIENMRGESIPIAVPMKPGVDPATVLTAWWTERTTPEVLPRFRVMVEIYALALGDRDRYGRFLDRFVGDWIEALEAGLRQAGCPEDDVASVATLLLSQMRGLSMDLLATGDRAPRRSCVRAFCRRLCRPRSGVVHAMIRSPSTLTDHHGRRGLTVGCHSSEKPSPTECFNSHFDLLRTRLDEKAATRS